MKRDAGEKRGLLLFTPNQIGIYIHWPFCAAKCPYCDFNTHVRERFDQTAWIGAYVSALEYYADLLPDKHVVSVFFGGGTPSLMHGESVRILIDTVRRLWPVANDIEITLEANPTSVERDRFAAFRDAGVTRISLGVQALNDADLRFLGRKHSVAEALQAVETAGRYFDRYSFDLIYGRPGQTPQDWEQELKQALPHARGHMALYQLTIERGTPFYMHHARGEFAVPGEAEGAELYHITQDIMEDAGLPAYEVSNHAAPEQACRHNLVYWHMADYIGIGAGAHGRFMKGADKYAARDHSAPDIWLQRVRENGHGAHPLEKLTPEDRFTESLMTGLRLREGVLFERCRALSGLNFDDMTDRDNIHRICDAGWAHVDEHTMRLTREGMLRLNAIVPYILK